MERLGRRTALFAIMMLPCFEPLPCHAQSSAPLPSTLAGTQQGRSTTRVPPPRPWPAALPAGGSASPGSVGSPSAELAASRGAQNAPQPSTPSTPTQASPAGPYEQIALQLKSAPLEPTDLRFPINLATALQLSDARPLIVAAAQASVWVAEAQLTRAKILWVPAPMFGVDYIRHDGGGPDFNKGVLTSPSVNYFQAGGSLAVSNPGLFQMLNLTDVFFEPMVARRVLNSRQWDIQIAKNDSLLMTADAYFKVHQYRGMYAGALYVVERGHDVVNQVSRLSTDLVPRVEIDRARNMLADLEQQATSAREAWRVHSADLTQVLRLDPRAVVVPAEQDHLQITLIDPATTLPDLQKIALSNRPELASQAALVQAAEARIRREKMRPFLPLVLVSGFQTPGGMLMQAGVFGLGPNSSLNQWTGRFDLSLQLVWQFDALGIGNLARIKQQRGDESRTIIDLRRAQDRVAAEVTEAQARLQSATARVSQAERGLRASTITLNGSIEGLGQTTRFGDVLRLVYRPQEVVFALQVMKTSIDQYFTTVAEYNRAQFLLFHALGYPASEITLHRPPGDVMPVDTGRPAYLPTVGNGPPPATH
jgi:outer membrane protein TolC